MHSLSLILRKTGSGERSVIFSPALMESGTISLLFLSVFITHMFSLYIHCTCPCGSECHVLDSGINLQCNF